MSLFFERRGKVARAHSVVFRRRRVQRARPRQAITFEFVIRDVRERVEKFAVLQDIARVLAKELARVCAVGGAVCDEGCAPLERAHDAVGVAL